MARSELFKRRSYNAWRAMKDRCSNPNHQYFHLYGGAGIKVCEDWLSYENFLSDMGEPSPGMQIDRIDSRLGYFKANCRWATPQQNAANRSGWGRYKTKGIYQRPSGRWAAVMRVSGKTITIGTFDTKEEAALAFDKAILEWHGEFALTNQMMGAI